LKLKLTVDGASYEVDVEVFEPTSVQPGYLPPGGQDRLPGLGSTATPVGRPGTRAPAAAPADEAKVCRSPFAGVVSRVSVQVGQAIQVGDVLMVLEAMKMETVITAPISGKIAKICAGIGDGVQKGQVLVEFE
jgi:biotin carboxyl carrier protein